MELTGSQEALDEALRAANDRFLRVMRRVLDRGVAEGQVPRDRAAGLSVFFTGVVNGMVTLARSGASRRELLDYVETAVSVLPRAPAAGSTGR